MTIGGALQAVTMDNAECRNSLSTTPSLRATPSPDEGEELCEDG